MKKLLNRRNIIACVKIIIPVVTLYSAAFIVSLFIYNPDKFENNSNNSKQQFFSVYEISIPRKVFWFNNSILVITNDTNYYTYDINKRAILTSNRIDLNTIIGKTENFDELVFCKWENKEVTIPSEFATKLDIYRQDRTLNKEISVHQTVMPTSCSDKLIQAETAFDFMEKKYFEISVENEEIQEKVPQNNYLIDENQFDKVVILKEDQVLFEIDKPNNIASFSISPDENSVALITTDNKLFVYIK